MPVTDWENRDAAWTDVAEGIRAVAERVMKPIVWSRSDSPETGLWEIGIKRIDNPEANPVFDPMWWVTRGLVWSEIASGRTDRTAKALAQASGAPAIAHLAGTSSALPVIPTTGNGCPPAGRTRR